MRKLFRKESLLISRKITQKKSKKRKEKKSKRISVSNINKSWKEELSVNLNDKRSKGKSQTLDLKRRKLHSLTQKLRKYHHLETIY